MTRNLQLSRLFDGPTPNAAPRPQTITGAHALWMELVRQGVDTVFGYPGGAIMPVYDAMTAFPSIHHVLVRHEQGASHMADGYARASGQVGVMLATSGPGATNLVTGLATAMLDSIPLVAITGQVPSHLLGTDGFQETDISGVTLPITKHNFLITRAEDVAPAVRDAFAIATSGRPGPVLIDICKDAQLGECELLPSDQKIRPPHRQPNPGLDPAQLAEAIALLNHAERPLILAGQGIIKAGASAELLDLVARIDAPVAHTLLGLGGFPASHPRCLGMAGMHGEAFVNQAIQTCDVLLAIGMRFDDRITGDVSRFAPNAKKIHVELDPSEFHKNVRVEVPVLGDAREVLQAILAELEQRSRSDWNATIDGLRSDTKQRDILEQPDNGLLYGAQVIADLWTSTKGSALIVTDVGQHQMWEAQYYPHEHPRTLLTSGGLGTMGFALPAAIGAAFTEREDEIWVICGDGGFQMTACELSTAVQENLNINIAIINNGYLGMVRQWQELFYEQRYTATPIGQPDFCLLAQAHGIHAQRVTERSQVAEAIAAAQAHDGPSVIDFRVVPEDIVYPMVPAGGDLSTMIRRPENAPTAPDTATDNAAHQGGDA